tara:strand:+ start:3031 stop:3852 length:822 start_codon:yes stop_codon:yes gene_type:complete
MKITKAVIPAAGLGTRLLPATKVQPKEMLPILDTPLIQMVVQEAKDSGIKDILIITGKGKRAIEDHFDIGVNDSEKLKELNNLLKDINIFFKRQSEPRGLGDAVLQAEAFVGNEPFAVLLGDDFYIECKTPATKQLAEDFEDCYGIIGAEILSPKEMTSKGMIISTNNQVSDVIEKPSIEKVTSNLAISGRYILPPEIFQTLKTIPPGHGGELQLTDAIRKLLKTKKFRSKVIKGTRIDIGTPLTYLKANIKYALSKDGTKEEVKDFLKKELS